MVGNWGDPHSETEAHLEDALRYSDDPEVRFHIRQAIQILKDSQRSEADA